MSYITFQNDESHFIRWKTPLILKCKPNISDMKTYNVNKTDPKKEQINYSRIIQLLIIAILIFLFFNGLKLVAPEAGVVKMFE